MRFSGHARRTTLAAHGVILNLLTSLATDMG